MKLEEEIRRIVRDEIARVAASTDYYDHTNSPLLNPKAEWPARMHNEVARSGKVEAYKVHGHWRIPKDALHSYMKKYGIRRGRATTDEEAEDIIDRVMKDDGKKRR